MIHVLFPLGIRLSTWIGVFAFEAVAVVCRDWRPIWALAAWLLGFEALFELTQLVIRGGAALGPLHALLYVGLAVVVVPWAYRRGARPSLPLLGAALVVW